MKGVGTHDVVDIESPQFDPGRLYQGPRSLEWWSARLHRRTSLDILDASVVCELIRLVQRGSVGHGWW